MIDVTNLIYDTIYKALYEQNCDSFIDFAEELVNNGIESENIFILLGLSKDTYEDKLYYFKKSLMDLNYNISFDTEFHSRYFLHISDNVINGKIDPLEAVYLIEKLYTLTDYNNLYKKFHYLVDSIDALQDGHGSLLSGMNKENIVEYIKNAFEIHKQVILLNLPENIFEVYLCRNCQKFIRLENVHISNKLFKYMGCPFCKTDKYETIMTNENLLRFLKENHPTTAST